MEGPDQHDDGDEADLAAPTYGQAHQVSVRLRPTRTAAEQARRALRGLRLPPPLADEAALLVSEMVTNSVRHAGLGPDEWIRLAADWSGTLLRVEVRDRPGRPSGAGGFVRPAPGAESGWGLYLVDRLASRWGTSADGYWFELHTGPAGPGG